MKALSVTFAMKGVTSLSEALDAFRVEAPAMDVVNDVATRTRQDALDTMLRALNLPRPYVEAKTNLTLATNPVRPRATIVGSGATITNLERYMRQGGGQMQVRVNWPNEGRHPDGYVRGVKLPWKPRVGAPKLGIPVGMKQAGLRIAVQTGAPKVFQHSFLIRPKKTPGVALVMSRSKGDRTGKGKLHTKVGPSVYQMFNAALTPDFLAKVEEQLSKQVLDATSKNLRDLL